MSDHRALTILSYFSVVFDGDENVKFEISDVREDVKFVFESLDLPDALSPGYMERELFGVMLLLLLLLLLFYMPSNCLSEYQSVY